MASERPSLLSSLGTLPKAGLLNLLVVYIVWGSTYLGIRVAVEGPGGFPPFLLGASRFLLGGALLLLFAAVGRQRLRLTLRDYGILALSGVVLWVGGNGLVILAEQNTSSGYAALVMGAVPIWVAAMDAVMQRRRPGRWLVGGLLAGCIGLFLLTLPVLRSGAPAAISGIASLFAAGLCWASGMMMQRRWLGPLAPAITSGYQQVFGGMGFAFLAWLLHEPQPHPSPAAWAAWVYLLVFGSLLAYTSFVVALKLLPMTLVTTYSYVNPLVAVVLGAMVLGERVTVWALVGAVFLLTGVAGVLHAQSHGGQVRRTEAAQRPADPLGAVEPSA